MYTPPSAVKITGVRKQTLIPIVLLIFILLLQILFVISTAKEKVDMHIDETYSYILSNSYDADRISSENSVWDQWIQGSRLYEFITVQKGEQFSYSTVYQNNTKDAHPPLYYWCLHTICSFFPDSFNVWYGIGLNIGFMLAASVLLFILGKLCFQDYVWALFPVAIWGSTAAFLDTVIFMRMYMLETVFTILLAILFCKSYKNGLSCKLYIGFFLTSFLGTFTHYYFAVFAFSITVFLSCHLLFRRKVKDTFVFGAVMLLSIIMIFVVYPAAITQITGSSTNNIGNTVWKGGAIFDFSTFFVSVLRLGYSLFISLIRGLYVYKFIFAFFFLCVLIMGIFHRKKLFTKSAEKESFSLGIYLFLSTILSFLLIAHVSKNFITLRYIYSIIPIGTLSIILIARIFFSKDYGQKLFLFFLIGLVAINFAGCLKDKASSYLYQDSKEYIQLVTTKMEQEPVVLLSGRWAYIPTANLTKIIHAKNLMMTSANCASKFDSLFDEINIDQGILLYIATDQNWNQCYDDEKILSEIMSHSKTFHSYKHLGYHDFCDVYEMER